MVADKERKSRLSPAEWSVARAAFEKPDRACTMTELATQLGVSRNALYNRAKRDKWQFPLHKEERYESRLIQAADAAIDKQAKQVADQALAVAIPTVYSYAQERVKGHLDSILKHCDKGLGTLDRLWEYTSDAASVKELSISLDRIDQVARRTFGLDDNSGATRRLPSRGVLHQPVLDAEIIPNKQLGNGSNT